MGLKHILKKLILGPKTSSSDYVTYLRSLGMTIGDNTVIYSPNYCVIDQTRPWMIEIGNNVSITTGVTILTHGYDWSVFKGMYGDVLGSAGRVKIGDNVFIGMHSTILKGVTIGDNVVIGANSLINKDVPDNCVVVGNPQRVVCDIDSYLEKRRAANSPRRRICTIAGGATRLKVSGVGFLRNAFSASSFGCSNRGIQACSATRLSRRLWPCAELAA